MGRKDSTVSTRRSTHLKKAARSYQKANPGVSYQQALDIVKAGGPAAHVAALAATLDVATLVYITNGVLENAYGYRIQDEGTGHPFTNWLATGLDYAQRDDDGDFSDATNTRETRYADCVNCHTEIVLERVDDPWMHTETGNEFCGEADDQGQDYDFWATPAEDQDIESWHPVTVSEMAYLTDGDMPGGYNLTYAGIVKDESGTWVKVIVPTLDIDYKTDATPVGVYVESAENALTTANNNAAEIADFAAWLGGQVRVTPNAEPGIHRVEVIVPFARVMDAFPHPGDWFGIIEGLVANEWGTCDECNAPYDCADGLTRCGDCGNCADHCTHPKPGEDGYTKINLDEDDLPAVGYVVPIALSDTPANPADYMPPFDPEAKMLPARMVRVGDRIDGDEDPYLDTPENREGLAGGYAEVLTVEHHRDGSTTIAFRKIGAIRFPRDHRLYIDITADDDDVIDVMDLRAGDMVDLAADPFADPSGQDVYLYSQYAEVVEPVRVEDNGPKGNTVVLVGFEALGVIGFPVGHKVRVGQRGDVTDAAEAEVEFRSRKIKAKIIMSSDIARCPILSLSAEHYREDGTCKCLPS
jgi:hypothetical protein